MWRIDEVISLLICLRSAIIRMYWRRRMFWTEVLLRHDSEYGGQAQHYSSWPNWSTRCWFNAVATSETLPQRWTSIWTTPCGRRCPCRESSEGETLIMKSWWRATPHAAFWYVTANSSNSLIYNYKWADVCLDRVASLTAANAAFSAADFVVLVCFLAAFAPVCCIFCRWYYSERILLHVTQSTQS